MLYALHKKRIVT